MQENNLKGLWIPYEILTNESLSDKEKYIYSLINLFNCCYMVQGFYSDNPHIEVSVLEADKILKFINKNLPDITN